MNAVIFDYKMPEEFLEQQLSEMSNNQFEDSYFEI